MAEKIVSPGVFTKENDLSFLQQGVAAIGTAFVGPFKEGPLVPTVINTQSEFEQLYGTVDDTYYTPLSVTSYLREAGQAVVARVTGFGGYIQYSPIAIEDGNNNVLGIIFSTTASGDTPDVANITGNSDGTFDADVDGETLTNISVYSSVATNIGSVFGSNAQGGKGSYAYAYFPVKAQAVSASGLNPADLSFDDQYFSEIATEAKTPYIVSQDISGERYKLFRFETISGGTVANSKIKVAITNIKAAGSVPGTKYSSFTVVVRQLGDTNRRKTAIESYSNVTLDPNSVNYINRVIGDRKISFNEAGKVTETGDWVNRSRFIRMVNSQDDSVLAPENIPTDCAPFGHDAYYSIIAGTNCDLIPAVTFVTSSATTYGGMDLDSNSDNLNYLKPIPTDDAGIYYTGSNVVFGLDIANGGNLTLTGTTASEVAKRNFLVGFQGGFDGQSPCIKNLKGTDEIQTNTQGFNCSTITASGSIAYLKQFAALSNAEEYDIQLMVTPGLNQTNHGDLIDKGLDMIQNRADAFYIIDPTTVNGTSDQAIENGKAYDSNYAAMYYPWVKTLDPITGKLISVPASTLLPAVYAANDRSAAEWFAPAGLNRGGLSSAVGVIYKLNQADRDNLYEAKINPIVLFANQGVVAFGQKTLQAKPSALDRINVRRLLLTIRKYVASTSRYLVFEQNTSTTRNKFINIVNPYLETIQQRQGLYAFKVIMDESNNTPDMIDRNFLKGSIYLQPTRTAEFIQIDFNILPTGATFGG
jgi:hypothetical protein